MTKTADAYPLLQLVGDTALARIDIFRDELPDVEIYAKCEFQNPGGSIKDRPVRRMLLDALESGELSAGKTIIDSSSGNAGISYAMIGAMMGFPVTIVIPGNASAERKQRIRSHGGSLVETDPVEGYDAAIRKVHELVDAAPDQYFMCDQYKNDGNWRAHYETTAPEIIRQAGRDITHFVAGVGTGGTVTGTGRRLKEEIPGLRVVSVVPETFPGIEGLKPLSAPEDIVPEIYDASVVDERVDVPLEEAVEICYRLARAGLFAGQSSGAYLYAAREVGRQIGRGKIVTMINDIGERYFSTRMWD